MAEALRRCMICGHKVTASFWACASCERKYGLTKPIEVWPEWARQLKRDHQAMRRAERRALEREITTSELDLLPDFAPDTGDEDDRYPSERGDGALDAAWSEINSWSDARDEDDLVEPPCNFTRDPVMSEHQLMRYAPYEDEASNREYRRANGIKERKEEE